MRCSFFRILLYAGLSLIFVPTFSGISLAVPTLESIGFTNYPLTPGMNVGPKAVLKNVEEGTRIRFRLYKKRLGPDKNVHDFTETTRVGGGNFSSEILWVPEEAGMYRLQVDVEAPDGTQLSSHNNEYFNITTEDYAWIAYLVRGFFVVRGLAGDMDGDGQSNTDADVYLYMKNAYENNIKYLFYFSFDLSQSVWYGLGTANGAMFSIDLADYFGLTSEGREGFVSTWLVGRSFVGYTPFKTSYGIGVIPVQFEPGWEDARDDMALYSVGGNAQLLTAHAQLDTRGNVKPTLVEAGASTLAKDFSIGATYSPQVSLEIQRSQINNMLARSIFSGSTAAVFESYFGGADLTLSYGFAASVARMISMLNNRETLQQARQLTNSDDGLHKVETFITQSLAADCSTLTLGDAQSHAVTVRKIGGPLSNPAGVEKVITDYEWVSDPQGALDLSNGALTWADGGVDEATLQIIYGVHKTSIHVLREGAAPSTPETDLAIDISNVPGNPIALTTGNVQVGVTADGEAATGASVRWEIVGDGVSVDSGVMSPTGSGTYEADIRWPNVDGYCNFVVRAMQGTGAKSASRVISFYPPNPDYGPSLIRQYPDRDIETTGGRELSFKVKASTSYDSLDRVEWYFDGMPVPGQTKTFSGAEASEGVATFAITPARQLDDYRTSVRARVYRDDGETESLFWAVNVRSNEVPVLTKLSPNTAETLVVPLGSHGETRFSVNVSDEDDDSSLLQWFINGVLVDDDQTGGGDPSSDESFTYTFSEVGDYTVEASVRDERGNAAHVSWSIHAGVQLEGNTPPEGVIEPPDGLNWDSSLRVGYRYDFDFEATDVDGNLGFGAVYVDNKQDWCPWYTGGDLYPYEDDTLGSGNGAIDSAQIYDIVFTSPGEHEIKFLVRDSTGAETTVTRTVTVEAADGGSSTAPVFLKAYPANTRSFNIASGTDLDFEFLMKDPDGDMEVLRTYVDGTLYRERSSNLDDTVDSLTTNVSGLSSGSHSIYFELTDRASNTVRSTTYAVSVGSAGNHSPVFEETSPITGDVLYADPNTDRIRVRVRASDRDGDLKYARLYNTAGPLSYIDGSEGGQDYDRRSIESDGVAYDNDEYTFQITQSGTIKVQLVDDAGHTTTRSWQVRKVDSFGTGSAPVIEYATVSEGEACNLKYEGEEMAFYGLFTDPDGDLDRIEAWKDGTLVDTESFEVGEGNASVFLDPNDVKVDSSQNDREKASPVVFKIIDKAGNVTEVNATYQGVEKFPSLLLDIKLTSS